MWHPSTAEKAQGNWHSSSMFSSSFHFHLWEMHWNLIFPKCFNNSLTNFNCNNTDGWFAQGQSSLLTSNDSHPVKLCTSTHQACILRILIFCYSFFQQWIVYSRQYKHRCNLSAHARVLLIKVQNGGIQTDNVVLVFKKRQRCFFHLDVLFIAWIQRR